MPDEIDTWSRRIKDVEREYHSVRFAVDRTFAHARTDNSILKNAFTLREIVRAAEMLESTYIMRLFAEFESAVRLYYQRSRKKRMPSKTEDLLNAVASSRGIPHQQLGNAHRVRIYRNELVHERHRSHEPFDIKIARGYLCHFLSFLPRDW